MKTIIYLLLPILFLTACADELMEVEQVPEPQSDFGLLVNKLNLSINGEAHSISFGCNDAPSIYQTRTVLALDSILYLQGYPNIPISDTASLKCDIIVYTDTDLSDISPEDLKAYMENNPEFVFFDLTYDDGTDTYKNQFYTEPNFELRYTFDGPQEVVINLKEPKDIKDCFVEVQETIVYEVMYNGLLWIEDGSKSIEFSLEFESNLRTW